MKSETKKFLKFKKSFYFFLFLCYINYMLGIDIENSKRFADWSKRELSRVFTAGEIEYASRFENSIEHFCGFYCVKEAIVKALDNKQIEYKKVEVLHTNSGKPYLSQTSVEYLLKGTNYKKVEISISHSGDFAIAVALLN